jgi:pimeloyl-ACP methyl ester carboxylesterase
MEPFLFGERNLLGIYHPSAGPAKDSGVVLCPPILSEYMRAHGCLRQLAAELASLGHHVLRFDYFGTGDSAGDISGATVPIWLDDISAACEELRSVTGVMNVSLVGVRLGAALAASAAGNCEGVRRMVLWDPVDDGARYLKGVDDTYEALIANHEYLPAEEAATARASRTGYALPARLVEGIGGLSIDEATLASVPAAFVMLTGKSEFDSGTWQHRSAECQFFDFECDWPTFSEALIFGGPLTAELACHV